MKPHPEVTTAELAAAYLAGASTLALERQYGMCHSAILYRLRGAGVTMRRQGAPDGNGNARRSPTPNPQPPTPGC